MVELTITAFAKIPDGTVTIDFTEFRVELIDGFGEMLVIRAKNGLKCEVFND